MAEYKVLVVSVSTFLSGASSVFELKDLNYYLENGYTIQRITSANATSNTSMGGHVIFLVELEKK